MLTIIIPQVQQATLVELVVIAVVVFEIRVVVVVIVAERKHVHLLLDRLCVSRCADPAQLADETAQRSHVGWRVEARTPPDKYPQ